MSWTEGKGEHAVDPSLDEPRGCPTPGACSACAEIARLRAALSKQNDEICQALGSALGYPKFCDDQANFPGTTEANGVCVGDHVAESIAAEAAGIIGKLRAAEAAAFRRGWLAGRLASTLAIAALPPPEDKP
jgi:hypothetical protein